MNMWVAIFIGGGLGSVARYGTVIAAARVLGHSFPFGTLIVNVVGSLLMGVVFEVLQQKMQAAPEMRGLLLIGFLGGFTTFSAFSFDVLKLADQGEYMMAAVYAVLSVALSIAAVFSGAYLIRSTWS